jgi:hypothetical protein
MPGDFLIYTIRFFGENKLINLQPKGSNVNINFL